MPGLILPVILLSLAAMFLAGEDLYSTMMFAWAVAINLVVAFGIGALIKFSYFKERPEPYIISRWWHRIDASSFPSIHTAYATVFMAQALILGDMIRNVRSERVAPLLLGIVGIAFYILIAQSRIILKRHFYIDTVFGTVVGLISTAFCLRHMDAIVAAFHLISIH